MQSKCPGETMHARDKPESAAAFCACSKALFRLPRPKYLLSANLLCFFSIVTTFTFRSILALCLLEAQLQKTYLLSCAPKLTQSACTCTQSNQRLRSRMKKRCILVYSKFAQWSQLSFCANAQADLNLR